MIGHRKSILNKRTLSNSFDRKISILRFGCERAKQSSTSFSLIVNQNNMDNAKNNDDDINDKGENQKSILINSLGSPQSKA